MDALRSFLMELTGICAAAGLFELLTAEGDGYGFRGACRLAALLCLMRAAARLGG